MLVMWEEKVDRRLLDGLLVADVGQDRRRSNTGMAPSVGAGMCRPHCAMRVSRPMVFSVTVLPPVLGPVMTRVSKSAAQLQSRSAPRFPWVQQRMPRVAQLQPALIRQFGRPCASIR